MKETICGAACARLPLLAYLEFKNQIEYYNFVSLLFSLNINVLTADSCIDRNSLLQGRHRRLTSELS